VIAVCGSVQNSFIAKLSPDGERRWIYHPMPGYADGSVDEAKFGNYLNGCAVLPDGSLLVADARNFKIRRLILGQPLLAEGDGGVDVSGGAGDGVQGSPAEADAQSGDAGVEGTGSDGRDSELITTQRRGPRFDFVKSSPDGGIQISLNGQESQSYRLEYSTDMLSWHPLMNVQTDARGRSLVETPKQYASCFFRAVEIATEP